MSDKYLSYRGDIKAALAVGGSVVFVTVHPEDHATAAYRLDADKLALTEDALPHGGVGLIADGDTLWIAGSDGQVYQDVGGKVSARGPKFETPWMTFALLSDHRLAVLVDKQIAILSRKDGKLRQTLDLPEPGTSLAADPTGQWLVAGTVKGTVAVFDCEEKPEFLLSEAQRLHEGAVTALLFEPEELRFLSAGADQKLLLTHTRGKLEPEDKGRGNNHTDVVTALIWGPGDRFYSGSRDDSVKAWPRVGAVRPATLKDGVGSVVALAIVPIHNRPHLVVACDDNTLRFFLLDAAGKFGDPSHRVHDAYARARHEFAQDDPRGREAALKALAEFNDTAAIEMIAARVAEDGDHGLRLLAVQLLGRTDHPRAPKYLEEALRHRDEAVRVAAPVGLRRHRGADNLGPLTLALQAAKADIGVVAVQALEGLAQRDDQALALLVKALNAKTPEVRQAALTSLEKVHDAQSPEANLLALGAKHADVRRLGLIRLFQRKMLSPPRVQAALRRRAEDEDAEVRRTAFLVSLYTREKLVSALRSRDADLHRQLVELETHGKEASAEEKEKKSKPAKTREVKVSLDAADHEPLLQATASRALDTCLRGARGLAVLGDARAFGLLLQLSRTDNAQARADVCRALAALDDPRSLKRLRSLLYDAEAGVRDAAFTALAHIHTDDPLLAAEAGLHSAFEDVRRRGLQALLSQMRKAPARADQRALGLLVYALNDSFEGVRSEAFKAALNLQVGGGGVQTSRFVLQSVHADVRREVLTEVMAQVQETWAWALLLEFYDDHDPKLREEAFQFAVKKTKELGPLEAGLRSQYADVRKLAVAALVKKHTPAAQALLVKALADTDKEVRQLALDSLISTDAVPPLTQALDSTHPDVRVRAARALARHGAAAALAPLLALATLPEPPERERLADWTQLVEAALDGLGELGDSSALPSLMPLLNSKHAALRLAAAQALMWVALPHHTEALRQALHHSDPQVKYLAALGLAYAGDPLGASLVFSDAATEYLTAERRLVAALTLGLAGEDQLVVFLDDANRGIREQALFLLMLRELKAHQGTPARCLAGLSSLMPRVRLTAARALEAFADPTAFLQFVVQLLNDRGDAPPWQITADTVNSLAEVLVDGSPQLRARAAHLTHYLVKEDTEGKEQSVAGRSTAAAKEEDAWKHIWSVFAQRFAAEMAALRTQTAARSPVPSQYTQAQLQQLAFGAYIGLVREQGAADGRQRPQVIRVRQTALNRLLALARDDAGYAEAARPVLVQALGDPNQAVRGQAFEHLQSLGMDSTALAAEALETGHTDLGIRGLELLTGQASAAEGQAVLEQAMLTRTDALSQEAARRLMKQRGGVAVAALALSATHEETRTAAVGWLASRYEKTEAARTQLRQALESRYRKVRRAAAFALAMKKDSAAFAALVKLLTDTEDGERLPRIIEALSTLGDPRTPDAFLDRLANDPSGTAPAEVLFASAGHFRRPENVDRLLSLMEKEEKWRESALQAVLEISGHDQSIDDPDDEQPDRSWEKEQCPRHDAVLARLLEQCLHLGLTDSLPQLIPAARWARGKEVEPPLVLLANHPDEDLRQSTVEALGWRLRKRNGSADALLKALQHKDAVTQFLAAEGLARAGRPEGLTVLLSAIDFMSDLDLRRRAVRALGELADARGLDALLRLASEDGHALQEEAAEAIGHLGKSAKAEDIFKLLERFAKGQDGIAEKALRGLRWFNTHAGWQLIRKRAVDPGCPFRGTAADLLGYNDDPATRDLLKQLVTNEPDAHVLTNALRSARRLWGAESLEPAYAIAQNSRAQSLQFSFYDVDSLLKQICDQGEPRRLFDILARCPEDVQQALATSLLNRPTLPIADARSALDSTDEPTTQLAARILGRAKATDAARALSGALERWRSAWEQRREQMAREGRVDARLAEEVTPVVQALLWAAGRVGVGEAPLLAVVAARPDDPQYRPIRLAAVAALSSGKLTKSILDALEAVVQGDDPETRTLAADVLGRHDAARAARLAEAALSDRVSFNRLTAGDGARVADTLRAAVAKVHYQGVALPHLIAQKDVAGLASVAQDRALPEATRLGAVEGLAVLALEPAEAKLREIGQATQNDEELRKAAWRALRRSKRARRPRAEVKA